MPRTQGPSQKRKRRALLELKYSRQLREHLEQSLKRDLSGKERFKVLTALSELECRQRTISELMTLSRSIAQLQDGLAEHVRD